MKLRLRLVGLCACDDNIGMEPTRSIELPSKQVDQLEADARDMGLSVAAYIEFLRRCSQMPHRAPFVDATRYVFKRFPKALRKLAE